MSARRGGGTEPQLEQLSGAKKSDGFTLAGATHVALPKDNRKVAFTLAEVLIILGIIGVVAALTIPGLISKYNEMVTIVALKKTYSELSQAIKMSEVQNGDLKDWEWPDDTSGTNTFVKKYILPYLSKNVKQCPFGHPCFKESWYWKFPDKRYNTAGNWQVAYSRYKYNDKTIAFMAVSTPCTSAENGYHTCSDRLRYLGIVVDVNGDRGESIMGKDVFGFTLFNYTFKTKSGPSGDNYGLQLGSIAGNWGAYRQPLENMFKGNPGTCKMDGDGYDCGLAIQKNSWKIPEQYPIKF